MSLPGSHVRSVAPVTGSPSDSRAAKVGRYWLPVLVWAAAIFIGSGDPLSSSNTSRFLEPLIHWLLPRLPHEAVDTLMAVIRKGGHLTEYAVLSTLCWRAVHRPSRGEVRDWSWRDAGIAMMMAALYAVFDEFHQAFVPSRTASPWDVLLDACGAAAGLVLVWGIGRLAKRRRNP
jgi:VanZ family protein